MSIYNSFDFSILKTQFNKNLLWSFFATISLAISGILINILIINYYGISVLGNFNITLALYIIFSQLSTGGIYFSTLHFSADPNISHESKNSMLSNGLLLVIVWSILISTVLYFTRYTLNDLFQKSDILSGINSIIPGLIFFSLNKVILSFINGLNLIKRYSIMQSLRYVIILLLLVLFIITNIGPGSLILVFSSAEFVLFIVLFFTLHRLNFLHRLTFNKSWFTRHFIHGIKALPSGLLQDILTRTDIIILGIMLTSYYVGIYSFPALIAEGFFQVPMAFMIVINPLISKYLATKDYKNIYKAFRNTGKTILAIMLILALIIILGFPILIKLFASQYELLDGWKILIILILSISICAPFYAFQMILNQSGRPFLYSLLMSIYFSSNVILNIILIGKYNVIGAAFASAIANLIFVVTFIVFIRFSFRHLNMLSNSANSI